MGFRNAHNPYGGRGPLVDKMIGTYYRMVESVAMNMDSIRYVVANMASIVAIAAGLRSSLKILGTAGEVGTTVSIPLPTGFVQDKITASSVILVATNGNIYGSESGMFSAWIQGGALKVTLESDASTAIEGAEVRWLITYEV